MQDTILLLPILLTTGAVAGVLAGLLGIGGGTILVPVFYAVFSALGYDGPQLMHICLATSLATIIPTSCRSLWAHHQRGAVHWGILKGSIGGLTIGASVGVYSAAFLSSDALKTIFATLVALIGLYLARAPKAPSPSAPQPHTSPVFIPKFVYIGLNPLIGFFSVIMGIGGGLFAGPLLMLWTKNPHHAIATASGFGALIALPATFGFLITPATNAPPFTYGSVNLLAFIMISAMTFLTAPIGATLAHKLDAGKLKRLFGLFLIIVALRMLL